MDRTRQRHSTDQLAHLFQKYAAPDGIPHIVRAGPRLSDDVAAGLVSFGLDRILHTICHGSGRGSTRATAQENIGQAIALWLDTAREYGDAVPEPQRASARTG